PVSTRSDAFRAAVRIETPAVRAGQPVSIVAEVNGPATPLGQPVHAHFHVYRLAEAAEGAEIPPTEVEGDRLFRLTYAFPANGEWGISFVAHVPGGSVDAHARVVVPTIPARRPSAEPGPRRAPDSTTLNLPPPPGANPPANP